MERFAALYEALDATTSTLEKVRAMEAYFRDAPPEDAAWGLYFLTGRKLRRLVGGGALRAWAAAVTGLPGWLVEESHTSVGDVAETVALLLDTAGIGGTAEATTSLTTWARDRLPRLGKLDEAARQDLMVSWWRGLPPRQVFLLNKLVTGSLRVGVSATLVARALAGVSGLPVAVVTHRLMGDWTPSASLLPALLAPGETATEAARPYPFYLASPIEGDPAEGVIGPLEDFVAEWKWDGIRAQIVRRRGETFVWSRGEELMTDRFPELVLAATGLPDGTVLDGEILAWQGDRPLPFAVLQTRIGRKKVTARELDAAPVTFVAYDLLEREGVDWRERPLHERQAELGRVVEATPSTRIARSEPVAASSWRELAARRGEARERGVEGLMLKRRESPYGVGRRRGDWWKWKLDPHTIDAVLVYAQAGHGRRATLFTDYTFAVWDGPELVPVTKAYSGLDDAEIDRLDRWVRAHTRERFGPVRSVDPELVFELGFEGIAASPRHRAGVALRFPRILRWRTDKTAAEADTLAQVKTLLPHATVA